MACPAHQGLYAGSICSEPTLRTEVAHAIYAEPGWPAGPDLTACGDQERQEWVEVGVWSAAERPEPRPAPPMAWFEAVHISADSHLRTESREGGLRLPPIVVPPPAQPRPDRSRKRVTFPTDWAPRPPARTARRQPA